MAMNKQNIDMWTNLIAFFILTYPIIFAIVFGTKNWLSEYNKIRLILVLPFFGNILSAIYFTYYIFTTNWEQIVKEIHLELDKN